MGLVIIRSATHKDAGALADLATQLGYDSNPEQILRRWAGLPSTHHCVFVAVAEGIVVGFVHIWAVSTLLTDDIAEIGGLVVDQRWRGKGIGRELMNAAEAWARQMGCYFVQVRWNIQRRGAHAFYGGLGYRRLKTSP